MNQPYQQRFSVHYEFPVYFGWDFLDPRSDALSDAIRRREPGRRHRVAFVLERRVTELWPGLASRVEAYVAAHSGVLELAAMPAVVPGAEESKNDPEAVDRLHELFEGWGLDRQSAIVIIGGGALQDLAGYAAATTHRGVRVVRLPTTVLSQNDSGVGVKNGVNAFGKKNFLGTFAPPFAVLDDFRFLETLDARDRAAGMAEAVKVALVKDAHFFSWLEAESENLFAFHMPVVSKMIERCAILHLRHIAEGGDPFELGSSRPLDFGHWSAHKLETLTRHRLRHGEAVSVGLCLDTRYSVATGLLRAGTDLRVAALLRSLGLPVFDPALRLRQDTGRRVVFEGINEFREHLGGDLTVMMLAEVGRGCEVRALDEGVLDECIDWLEGTSRAGKGAAVPEVDMLASSKEAAEG